MAICTHKPKHTQKHACARVHTHTHVHTHHAGVLCSHKKVGIMPFTTTWMDLEGIMLSEVGQSEKDKYHMILLIWNLKNK